MGLLQILNNVYCKCDIYNVTCKFVSLVVVCEFIGDTWYGPRLHLKQTHVNSQMTVVGLAVAVAACWLLYKCACVRTRITVDRSSRRKEAAVLGRS